MKVMLINEILKMAFKAYDHFPIDKISQIHHLQHAFTEFYSCYPNYQKLCVYTISFYREFTGRTTKLVFL